MRNKDKVKMPNIRVHLEPTVKPRQWVVLEDLEYHGVTVPAGFVTDLASIPMGLRWFFPHGGAKAAPAVIHDYLYRTPKACLSKGFADKMFLRALEENEVKYAKVLYKSVRAFGSSSYNKRRR